MISIQTKNDTTRKLGVENLLICVRYLLPSIFCVIQNDFQARFLSAIIRRQIPGCHLTKSPHHMTALWWMCAFPICTPLLICLAPWFIALLSSSTKFGINIISRSSAVRTFHFHALRVGGKGCSITRNYAVRCSLAGKSTAPWIWPPQTITRSFSTYSGAWLPSLSAFERFCWDDCTLCARMKRPWSTVDCNVSGLEWEKY